MSEAAGAADERTPDERAAALEPMLQSPNPVVRKSAVVALGKLGSPTAARMLCRALDDGDEGVRALSCQALGRLANQASLPALLSHAHDPSAGVRAGVLWGLANIAAHGGLSADARRSLFAPVVAMAFDPDDGVRADAAAVIGTLRDERATEALSTLLEDACPRVRANACASLGLTDDAAGMEFLLGMLERRENPLVQVSALDGVARRAERGAVPEESEASRRAVRDTCSLAQAASEGAPEASSEDAADAVGASDVRATAAWAIGFVARTAPSLVDEAICALEGSLASGQAWEERYAVESLARIGGAGARSALERARGRLSDPEAAEQLSRVLEDACATHGQASGAEASRA